MSYTIPNISFIDDYFVHQRDLGKKMSGSHLYPNVPWSDVVLQHVPIEVPMRLADQDKAIMESLYSFPGSGGSDERIPTRVGYHQSGPGSEIQMSESECRNTMFEPDDLGWAERMLNRRECKRLQQRDRMKYEVKPRNKEKENRNKYFKHNQ